MIDTTGGVNPRAFDTGLAGSSNEQRIDLSNLIDDGSKPASNANSIAQTAQQTKLVHQMKKVNTECLVGAKRTYSVANCTADVTLNSSTRPF